MFKALREKLTSWFKKPKGKPKKKTKKIVITEEKPSKKNETRTKNAKKQIQKSPEIIPKKQEEKITQTQIEESPILAETTTQKPMLLKNLEISERLLEPIEKKPSFFTKLIKKISTSSLTQEQFDELFQDLGIILLENNVSLEVVDKIRYSLSKDLVGIEVKKSEVESTIINSLKESILSVLMEPPDLIKKIKEKDEIFTIIFVGINGSGKTTTLAKVAYLLKNNRISCVLAAADTFRAASIEQLKMHAQRLNIPVIAHGYGTDPAAVAFDAKKYAKAHNIKAVLIDTAGRMYTKTNLMKEMEKIVRISQPNLKIFVGESITGNDATEQAKTFNEAINIDGIILTKAEVDEKAGTILSVSHVTQKPIYFLGTGQEMKDLIPFTKKTVLKNIGLG